MQTLTLTTSHITHYRGTYHDREPVILYQASFGKIFVKFRSIQETIDNVKVNGKNREVQSRQCQTRDVDRDGDDDGVGGNQVGDRGGLRGLPRIGLRFRGQQLVLLSNAATSSQLCLGECPKLDFNML